MSLAPLLFAIPLLLSAAFAGVYCIGRRVDNYGLVDLAWSFAFAPVAVAFAFAGDGWTPRRIIFSGMIALWSVRLGSHLALRVLGKLHTEDGRYQQLRRDWAGSFHRRMFGFFQLQAVLVVVLAAPLFGPFLNTAQGFAPMELIGLAVWTLALVGETLADQQLAAFKLDPTKRGRVCTRGLWGWSRHPNYFFEWLVWVGFALFSSASPFGWPAVLCPALMLFFLLKLTGVKYTEEQLLRSKGEEYRRYQMRTSAFVPLPPKITTVTANPDAP